MQFHLNVLEDFLWSKVDRTFFLCLHGCGGTRAYHTLRLLNLVVFKVAIILFLSQKVELVI